MKKIKNIDRKNKKYKAELKGVQSKEKENWVTKLKENKKMKNTKESNVKQNKISLTLENFYHHFENLWEEYNSVDEHVTEPVSVALEIREIQILNDSITENKMLKAIGKLRMTKHLVMITLLMNI